MKLVNLDWLEVYCLEPAGRAMPDATFFVAQGYEVKAREYGTPQYREMFTIFDGGHFPMYPPLYFWRMNHKGTMVP